jgi:sugar lactone lactonase YvrE
MEDDLSQVQALTPTHVADGFGFGEGPRWHEGRLWFTDGPSGTVLTLGDDNQLEVAIETRHPSGLGWLPDETLVICTLLEARITFVAVDGTTTSLDLSDLAWSTNDLVVGPTGHIYVDLYNRSEAGIIGAIGLVTPDRAVRVVADDLQTPNGLGIRPDGSTLIVSETQGHRLLALTIEADGGLSNRRVFADLDGRRPDGLCLDEEGAVWVGCYDTGEFLRVLDGGEVTHRIETAPGWAVAPALGGPDRRTLYLVVNDTTTERHTRGDSDGRIEQVRVDVPGAGWP